MKKIILKVLDDYAEIHMNMASPTAREILAKDLEEALTKYFGDEIESITTGTFKNKKK